MTLERNADYLVSLVRELCCASFRPEGQANKNSRYLPYWA